MIEARILVVDDTPSNLTIVFHALEKAGYRVYAADSGKAALARLKHLRPDLILMDVMMKDLNGYETCQQIKLDEQFRDIPVLFMTAWDDAEAKIQAFKVGGVDCITKPISGKELQSRVDYHLKVSGELAAFRDNLQYIEQTALMDVQFRSSVCHDMKNVVLALSVLAKGLGNEVSSSSVLNEEIGVLKRLLDLLVLGEVKEGGFSRTYEVNIGSCVALAYNKLDRSFETESIEVVNTGVEVSIRASEALVTEFIFLCFSCFVTCHERSAEVHLEVSCLDIDGVILRIKCDSIEGGSEHLMQAFNNDELGRVQGRSYFIILRKFSRLLGWRYWASHEVRGVSLNVSYS